MADELATRFVVCRVGTRRFALPVSAVREVCTDIEIIRMPGVAAPVQGVANVRGSVVTVVRAADLLRLSVEGSDGSSWLVVLQYRSGRVALSVDEVEDLGALDATIPAVAIEPELDHLFESVD